MEHGGSRPLTWKLSSHRLVGKLPDGSEASACEGEGSVYRRASDGLWVGMLDLGVVDGRRCRKTVYGQTEREALQKLSTLRAAHDRGIDLLAPAVTLGQWIDVWLSDIKGFDGTRPRTLTLYEGLAERYVKPVIGGVRLDKLTPAHVRGSLPRLATAGLRVVLRRCGTCTSWSGMCWVMPTGWSW